MANYLIIGGSSGIGQQIVAQLTAEGHNAYTTYNSHSIENPNTIAQQLNVLDEVLNFDFLPETIDSLVYCPGAISLRPFARIPAADFM